MADSTPIAELLKEETLQEMLMRHRAEGIDNCAQVWRKAEVLQRYAQDSDQWGELEGEPSAVRYRDWKQDPFKTKRLSINEIRQVVQAAAGRQIMQRFERSYRPRKADAERFGEVMSQIDKAMMAACDAEQAESAAFRDGPCIQGVSCVRWEYDNTGDPRGQLAISEWPIFQVMWGRDARQINLKDRSWHRAAWWMSAKQVRDRWPRKWKKVFSLAGTAKWASFESPELSSRTPWSGDLGNQIINGTANGPAFWAQREGAFWVELEEWRELQVEFKVARPANPSMSYAQAIAGSIEGRDLFIEETMDAKGLNEFEEMHLAATSGEVPDEYIVPRKKIVFKYAYIIGTEIMETGEIPVGAFTFLFMTGFRRPSPTGTRWIGLTENLVQAQKYNNLLLMALYKNLQINPKGVLIYEQGMFKNKKDALEQFTSPGGLLEVGRGKLTSGGKPYAYEAGGTQSYASMVSELMNFYRGSIPRLAGFNPAALGDIGSDPRRISGQVIRQVEDAAVRSNAELFDSYRHYRREGGRLFLSFMRTFWGDRLNEIVEIVGEENVYTVDEQGNAIEALPPAEMWSPSAWRLIDIQEVVPDDDERADMWRAMGEQGVFQIVQSPQQDTGQPLFDSQDLAEMVPKIKAPQRERMLRRIKAAKLAKQQAEAAAEQGDQGATERPPATSISLKDLPPSGQSQLAAQAGITLSPEEFGGIGGGGNGAAPVPEEQPV